MWISRRKYEEINHQLYNRLNDCQNLQQEVNLLKKALVGHKEFHEALMKFFKIKLEVSHPKPTTYTIRANE